MSTTRTVEYVETMMKGTQDTLALYARAIRTGQDISDDETTLMPKGEGMNACDELRALPLEQITPEHARWSDFVFTIGGPRIYIRNNHDDTFVMIGQVAGLETPIVWPILKETTPDVYEACELLMAFDFIDLQIDPAPFEFASHPVMAEFLESETPA